MNRRPAIGGLVTLALAWPLGCSDSRGIDTRPPGPYTASTSQALPRGAEVVIHIPSEGRPRAIDSLHEDLGPLTIRPTNHLIKVEAGARPLATADSDDDRVATLIEFLSSYGGVLLDPEDAPSEEIVLSLVRGPVPIETMGVRGAIVLFRQRVDAFGVADTLVGGRFIGLDLQMVAGRIFDPTKSPARISAPQLPTADSALPVFAANGAHGPETPEDLTGIIYFRTGQAYWKSHAHVFDAITSKYLGEQKEEQGDPAEMPSAEVEP